MENTILKKCISLGVISLLSIFFHGTYAQSGEILTGVTMPPVDSSIVLSQDGKKLGLFSTMDLIDSLEIKITETKGSIQLVQAGKEQTELKIKDLQEVYSQWINEISILNFSSNLEGNDSLAQELKLSENTKAITKKLINILEMEILEESITTTKSILSIEQDIREAFELKNIELETLLETQNSKLKGLKSSLEMFTEELPLQQNLLHELYKNLWNNIIQLVSILASIFGISYVLKKIIHLRANLSEEKKHVLSGVVGWIRNIAFIILIAAYFFSELLNFLPFVAILGTAIGFALRDIISSFIAWFLIGHKDSVYKLGDVIEVEGDNVFGRVFKISPVVTTIQELGLSGPSGMYKTFPNKAVFEKSIKNISKINGWVYITVDIILDKTSSISLSKQILLESMQHVLDDEKYSSPFDARAPFKKYGITHEHMYSEIFLDIKPQGIFLRGKMFVYWAERHAIRSDVVELFFERAQKEDTVVIKQLEIG